jgi:hypothetical protein
VVFVSINPALPFQCAGYATFANAQSHKIDIIKNPYMYEPFKDKLTARPVRMLTLHVATSSTENIKCELFNTTLDARENFEALSYALGDPKGTYSSRDSPWQRYIVSKNLESALRHLHTVIANGLCAWMLSALIKPTLRREASRLYRCGGIYNDVW